MRIAWTSRAWEDFTEIILQDKQLIKRTLKLIDDLKRHPLSGIGKPESLSGQLSGYHSRRIDQKNRIVYRVEDDTIIIVQCGTHYGDK